MTRRSVAFRTPIERPRTICGAAKTLNRLAGEFIEIPETSPGGELSLRRRTATASVWSISGLETHFSIRFFAPGDLQDFSAHGGDTQCIHNFNPTTILLEDLADHHAGKPDGVPCSGIRANIASRSGGRHVAVRPVGVSDLLTQRSRSRLRASAGAAAGRRTTGFAGAPAAIGCRFAYGKSYELVNGWLSGVNACDYRRVAGEKVECTCRREASGGFANGGRDACGRIHWTRAAISGRV
jgi:hypothetical protein